MSGVWSRPVRAAAAAVVLVSSSAAGPVGAAEDAGKVIADSVLEFSAIQGQNGWWYGYWNATEDDDGRYDPAKDFIEFESFGGDSINRFDEHAEFSLGSLWYLEDGRFYTALWADGGHPHAEMELGSFAKADHWVVRRWVSSSEDSLIILGRLGKSMPWGANWSGAVVGKIVVDGRVVYSTDVDDGGGNYAVDVQVDVGTTVDFLIGPKDAIGVIDFTALLRRDFPAKPAGGPEAALKPETDEP